MSIDEEMRRISLAANIECNRQMQERAGMSEVFDPEKVVRYEVQLGSHPASVAMITRNTSGDYVLAADFLKLLALYRELRDRPYSTWPQGG